MVRIGVNEFNSLINSHFKALGEFIIEGEITQMNISGRGGVSIVMKDIKESALVNVSGYAPLIQGLNLVNEGMQVAIWGVPEIYSPYGKFSIKIYKILPLGAGALKEAYEQLKRKLNEEGLFDDERKRSLPQLVRKIALLTAKDSAAQSDFLKILQENKSGIEIDYYPVSVQGKHSEAEILDTFSYLEKTNQHYDCIVLTRGGGSLEDLITFNEERIARAIFAASFPVIVAVGHERDESIADFVADVRASTPSQAAYYLVSNNAAYLETIMQYSKFIEQELKIRLDKYKQNTNLQAKVVEQRLRLLINSFESRALILAQQSNQLGYQINKLRFQLQQSQQLISTFLSVLDTKLQKVSSLERILSSLDPNKPLKKGYAIICDTDQHTVTSSKSLKSGQTVKLILKDGDKGAKII